jgi:cytochrome d ubiquinol oxidase subunit I
VTAIDLDRWQFGITTVYHFIFVPLTIGLAPLVALLQSFWVKTGKDEWYRLTRFFGKLLLINFALGIVTGIVQEFQFGMNWSEYSRFVGDIFGAPLAMEALAAFFIESTFLGIWIFGWGRLAKGVHLACAWLVAFAVNLSAFFILSANSFMQYPVGAKINPATSRAEMASLGQVLFSKLSLSTFWHTISTSFVVAGTFMAGIAIWKMVKEHRAGNIEVANVYRKAGKVGTVCIIIAGISLIFSGHHQAQEMIELQPTKMAAAEALCVTPAEGQGAPFTVAAFGTCQKGQGYDGVSKIVEVPDLLSFLATYDAHAQVKGADTLRAEFAKAFPNNQVDPIPNVMATFWSFRLMMGFGIFSALLALTALILLWRKKPSSGKWLKFIAGLSLPMPFLGAAFGWIFTEMGRQPWIVYPIYNNGNIKTSISLLTQNANSTVVSGWEVGLTVVLFTLLYLVLACFWFYLMKKFTNKGLDLAEQPPVRGADLDTSKPLTFAY